MSQFKEKSGLSSIRKKIGLAFLCGCVVMVFSWMLAREVFKETFSTIDVISKPNPKLLIVNKLFQGIQHLDQVQKLHLLQFPDKPYTSFMDESKHIINLLDSLKQYCADDTLQAGKINRMEKILYERDELFLNYLKFRYHIRKSNPLSKSIRQLSDYIAKHIEKADSNVVKTTKKNTTTATLVNIESKNKKPEKKESFFKRVFGRKKNKEDAGQPQQLITEEVQVTIDTVAMARRDSLVKNMERNISAIEQDRYNRRSLMMNQELKLVTASNIFIDELEQLLRQVQSEEIRDLQRTTSALGATFSRAFDWGQVVLYLFMLLVVALIFMIFSDIARSNRMSRQLLEAKEKAEYLEQAKHRFLANMSHEIRTPLQAILGFAEQVKDQAHPKKEALAAIHRSSEYLLQIVNEVLDYSRIVSGKFTFESYDFDMADLIAELSDIMEGQAERKKIGFRFSSDALPHTLYSGDAFRLKQILFNLLGNAIKFTAQGEVGFFVSFIDKDPGKTEFVFEIKDTGIGMDEQELKRIFNSFEQGAGNIQRRFGGTGLGLSIAKTLTDMQGGALSVSSEKNEGSVFKVRLTYVKSFSEKPREQQSLLNQPVYAKKVLVIDDDAFILQLCDLILQKYNIAHACYASPEKLIGDAADDSVGAILLDIRMPAISGIDLYRILKQKTKPGVKFVALTAQALPDEKEAILKEGFDQVLLKPFREKDLMQLFTGGVNDQSNTGNEKDHLDLSSIRLMCMNDEALFKKSLGILTKQSEIDLAGLRQGFTGMDHPAIAHYAHRLAAKVGQAGFNSLSLRLRAIEVRANNREDLALEETDIIKEIAQAIEKVKAAGST